jgi:hypothetical protein
MWQGMSSDRETALAALEAFNRRDVDAFLALSDPGVEFARRPARRAG